MPKDQGLPQRLKLIIQLFCKDKNTLFAQRLHTNEARIRSYLTGDVMPKYDFMLALHKELKISIDWLISGQGSMTWQENVENFEAQNNPKPIGLPVYDCDFTCGFDEVFNDQTLTPSDYFDTGLNRQADFWCSVQGKSMMPELEPGDKIALRACSLESFEPGHIYAVVMDELRTVKLLRRVPGEPSLLEFVATNPDYGTERYPISRIIKLYRVVGKLHSF